MSEPEKFVLLDNKNLTVCSNYHAMIQDTTDKKKYKCMVCALILQEIPPKQKIFRPLGLRFDTLRKDDVDYLAFYDIDKQVLDEKDKKVVDEIFRLGDCSYILYKTKHGYHAIGLTALHLVVWSSIFLQLKQYFHSYYSGVVIRLSRKPEEKQELVALNEKYGKVVPNLFNIFAGRFDLTPKPWVKELSKHILVFEHYRTENK